MESFIPLSMLNTFELKVSQLTCLDMGVCYSDFNFFLKRHHSSIYCAERRLKS